MLCLYTCIEANQCLIAPTCLYGLVSVSESVLVKFSVLYLEFKVLEKSGIGPLLI